MQDNTQIPFEGDNLEGGGGEEGGGINRKAVIIFVVAVVVILATAVWGGITLGKAQAQEANEQLTEKLNSTQAQLTQTQSTSSSLQQANAAMEEQLLTARDQVSKLQASGDTLEKNNQSLQTQLSATQTQLSQVTSQSAALQTQLKTTQTQLTQVQNANTLLQSKLTAAQLDADTLRAQLGTWYAWARTIPSVPSFTGGPSIILSSASGTMGATVTVTGSGLPPSASGIISFDMNRNGIADPGETLQTVNTSSGGAFSTSIVVPSLAPGAYSLQAAFPAGTAPQASTNFSVTG